MQWHDWNEEAFARARERGTPVLLLLRASWCPSCRELETGPLADPRVATLLGDHFVCVRVDKDEHQDVDERYRAGAWPTLALLSHEGEVLSQNTWLDADELVQLLELVRAESAAPEVLAPRIDAWEQARRAARDEARGADGLTLELVDDVLTTLKDTADPVHGGWGRRHKFPHPEALHLSLVRWSQTGDQATLQLVLRTLRRMQAGEIYDRVEGGFYRYASQADWTVPHHQKMLDSNAQRLLAYVEAYQALGEESFRTTAEGILGWLEDTLLDPVTCGLRGSQDADPVYAHLATREQRAAHGAPECDPTIYTDRNATAVCALLKAGLVLGEDRWRVQALTTLDFLLENLWDEREGMYHYWDGTYNLPGLLTDQATTLRALVEAMHYAGANRYLAPALALARGTLERLQSEDGSLYDSLHDQTRRGTLRERKETIQGNAVFAEALLRLAHMARDPELAKSARTVLASFVGDWRRYGHLAASYGRAVDLLHHQPVHVTIVGPHDADKTRSLREAALGPYVASRIVQTIDPELDEELFARTGLPLPLPESVARAYVLRGRESYAETSRPERVAALMTRTERSN